MRLLKLVPDNTNVDFMRWRNVALVLSVLLTVASLSLVGLKGLNLGIDFIGGQMVRTTFAQPIDVEQLRARVNALGIGDANIQEAGGPRTYQVRLPKPPGGDAAASQAVTRVRTMIVQSYPGARSMPASRSTMRRRRAGTSGCVSSHVRLASASARFASGDG